MQQYFSPLQSSAALKHSRKARTFSAVRLHSEPYTDSDVQTFCTSIETTLVGPPRIRVLRNGATAKLALAPLAVETWNRGKQTWNVIACTHADARRYDGAAVRELERERGCGKPKHGSKAWLAQKARQAAGKASKTDTRPKPKSVFAAVMLTAQAA